MSEPVYQDDWLRVYQGDSRDVLLTLPERSVHAVVTSPPYWGLRDYGTGSWEGGDPECDHLHETQHQKQGATSQRAGRSNAEAQRNETFKGACGKCGAIRVDAQIGMETSPQAYVSDMVEIFRGIWRVLRDDGTVWLNIGDSYANDTKWGGSTGGKHVDALHGQAGPGRGKRTTGLKAKDLIGIPWRVALALQEDGWYLRSDCIWSKPNPMPSSVTDRPSVSHEYVFLLTKSEHYFYDIDATREPHKAISLARIKYGLNQTHPDGIGVALPPVRTTQVEGAGDFATAVVTREEMGDRFAHPLGRNMRTVWEVATVSYPGAHYAVFPPKLVEPCVKASTSEKGVCAECGAPWERITERTGDLDASRPQAARAMELAEAGGLTDEHLAAIRAVGVTDVGKSRVTQDGAGHNAEDVQALADEAKAVLGGYYREFTFAGSTTTGWQRTCDHEGNPVPATVLDPFAGSGTVGKVSQSLSRRAVLIDLNTDYLAQQLMRNAQIPLGL